MTKTVNIVLSLFLGGVGGFLASLASIIAGLGAFALVAGIVLFYGRIPPFPFKARVFIVLAALVAGGGGYITGQVKGEKTGQAKAELVCKQQQLNAQAEGRAHLERVQTLHKAEIARQKFQNDIIESDRLADQKKAEESDVSLANTEKELEQVRAQLVNAPKCSIRNISSRLHNK